MNQRDRDKTLALAGVVQAANLVNEVANNGVVNNQYFLATLASVFKIDADSAEDVYGGRDNVRLGLKTLDQLLSFEQSNELMPIVRYSLNLLHLERKLSRNIRMLNTISEKLTQIKSQADYFSLNDERVIASLANLYQETISTFNLRIKVTGNPLQLKNSEVAHHIRALLLCGIRSAVLWRQMGGTRVGLFLSLSKYNEATQYWLNH